VNLTLCQSAKGGPPPKWLSTIQRSRDKSGFEKIREVLDASPFYGEGHRKVWARLRLQEVRTSKARVLRLMREAQLLAPSRVFPKPEEAQFQQLSAVEQRILRSASVVGERFSVWAVTTTVEAEGDSIEEACEGLTERLQFIKGTGMHELANGQLSAHYEFRHSLYREVLYRHLSEVSRSKLHLLLAQRLKSFSDPCGLELAAELALHFEAGRDYEQAIRYSILAAKNAAGRFAYRDSIEILHHALELVAKLSLSLRAEIEIQILELNACTWAALRPARSARVAAAL
jgi:hypothetical protein